MEAQPLRALASTDDKTGSGGQKKIERNWTMEGPEEKRVVVKEESSSSPELGLVCGAMSAALAVTASTGVIAREKCLFTEAQWRDFQHQVFIFKHFQYVTGMGHLGFAYGKMADPEPQRCRRSDGKKWRCSKNVVPDQKYCEQHMHRGRNRSRKHVETSKVNSSLLEKPSDKLHAKFGLKAESIVPNPLGIQLNSTFSSAPSSNPNTVETSSNNRYKCNNISADTKALFSSNAAAPGSTLTTVAGSMVITSSSTASVASNTSNQNTYKKNNSVGSFICNNGSIGSYGKGNFISDGNKNNSARIGFSPRSVLQGSTVSGHSSLSHNNGGELEPGRCRRTDGKKWRCRSAVLPNQKYCASHVHRGAKKRFAEHEPATIPPPSAVASPTIARPPCTTTANIQKAYCRIPNTNLSMSIPASSSLVQCNEKSTGSSDTDTTITDNMDEYSYVSF